MEPSHGAKDSLSRAQWMVLIAAFLGWLFDGFEMGLFPIIARPALQDLLGEYGDKGVARWMGYITALFLLGAAAGGLVFGWLGDRIGRVRALSLSILTYSLFTGLGYFAQAPWHLGAFRFIAALGMGGEWSLGVALVMECWPEKLRPLLAGAIGAAANVGFFGVALVSYNFEVTVGSWRWMLLVGAAPALLVFFIRLFVPESERWKASVRESAARPLREIWAPGRRRNTALAVCFASIALIGTWGMVQWTPLWADQLTGGSVPKAKTIVQMLSSLGAILGCLLAPLIGARIGRRPAYFGLCLVSLAVCSFLFRYPHEYDALFKATIFVTGAATAAFYGWFPLYLPELFPTRMRATGQGISFNFGRVFAAFGALTAGNLVAHFEGSYPRAGAVVTLIYALGLILIWFGPETRGKPLPR
jgi:SHS family sialic acid transporter-like MFS transporter